MAITIDGADNKLEIGANATGPSSLRLYEDTDNGTNYVSIIAPSAVTSNRTITLPDASGTLNTSGAVNEVPAGSASAPSIYPTGDTNTGIFFPAADTIAFGEGGTEVMRINSSGNVGLGTTSPVCKFDFGNAAGVSGTVGLPSLALYGESGANAQRYGLNISANSLDISALGSSGTIKFFTGGDVSSITERARITSGGDLLVGTTNTNPAENNVAGTAIAADGRHFISAMANEAMRINRGTNDGTIVFFHQAGTAEGSISVSGTTVSYNGGHLSRWAQMLSKPDLLKGTVMSNLDEMNVYTDAEGNPVENEQLNRVKVSDVEGDPNVAGIFVNWEYDEAHQVDEINMAMTGDMIIRIAQGVVVQKGDLLISAGDGTAKPQEDDIVRSKTVAKVTSNHVTCTYTDGSYCVPCVLMAC
jgi:hypothetical protein